MAGTFIISGLRRISSASGSSGKSWGGGNNPFLTTRPTDDTSLLAAINSSAQENPSLYAGWKTGDINVIGIWLIRFKMLFGDAIISLDGGSPISFTSLPSGATPLTATLSMRVAQPTSLNGDLAGSLKFQRSALVESLNLIQSVSHAPVTKSFVYTGNLTFLNIIADGCGIDCVFATPGTIAQEFYNLSISGTYGIQLNPQIQPSIEESIVRVGDKIKIDSPVGGLDGVVRVDLSYTDNSNVAHLISLNIDSQNPSTTIDGVVYSWLNFIILQQSSQFWFYLPYGFGTFSGEVLVTLVGNGVQFSGSVPAGVLNILFADVSGAYNLVKGQTDDILYVRSSYTTNTKLIMLPDMQENEIYENDFFNLLGYPYKILSQDDIDEDFELSDYSYISIQQLVATPTGVEIPSPFIKTAFLP